MKERSQKGLENLSNAIVLALRKRHPNATDQELLGMAIAEGVGIRLGLEPVGDHPDTVGSLGEVSRNWRWRDRIDNQ